MMGKRNKIILLAAVLVFIAGVTVSAAFYANDGKVLAESQTEEDLPLVGSVENLRSLLDTYAQNNLRVVYKGISEAAVDQSALVNESNTGMQAASTASADYSSTNIQVEGVDEGDQVKTDGQYIYQINKNRVQIIKAAPADKMQLVNTIKFSDDNFIPAELYIEGNYMIVVGDTYFPQSAPLQEEVNTNKRGSYYRDTSLCRAVVYDIKDKEKITQVRRLVLEGDYLSSRLTDSKFYLLSNCYVNNYAIQNDTDLTPLCKDTVKADRYEAQDIKTIRYFPGCITPNYLVTGSIDLKQMDDPAEIKTYLGGGENIYASAQNLYVAISQYENDDIMRPMQTDAAVSSSSGTKIFKFNLQGAKLRYQGEGQVPGTILNQFSMDEYGDHFRIATTSGEIWRNDQNTSQNNVYILDKELQLTGKLENIAPGEKIYSTRFMGDRAYMVTFKKVDPFFVLDLTDPAQPQILGKLKIPGYSDYLHPYDENHIIGFGKDTAEQSGDDSRAYYQGMKIAIFDVTDVSSPVEMSKVIIGDRGTDSELLNNHKALLFSREKNLLAFPVTEMTVSQEERQSSGNDITEYGSFSFQGAYVYKIDLQQGLQLKGRITHLDSGDYLKSGSYWGDNDKNISRILYIGDTLYTLSPAMIKSNQIDSLQEKQTLLLQ
ncbi:MAG TPA: beta-propeller domain-containing protein [Syntrophomonas sp.]|nr:beta-propeller domain-containing protein [Syntrophomonas sp.]